MRKTHIAIVLIFIACMGIYFYYRSRPEAVDDHMGPEIHMEETTIRVPSNASEADILAGITAVDAMDGDVTGNLFVEQLLKLRRERQEKCHHCGHRQQQPCDKDKQRGGLYRLPLAAL